VSADKKKEKEAEAGYDKYIEWKIFIIPVVLLFAVLLLPATKGMVHVGTEYGVGDKVVVKFLAEKLFSKSASDLDLWQTVTVNIMEKSLRMAALSRSRFLERDVRWCRKNNIATDKTNLERAKDFVKKMSNEQYRSLMDEAADQRMVKLSYEKLSGEDKETAKQGIWKLKVALGMMCFVIVCFITACIPLPAVAFIMGLIAVLTGIVSREDVASMYWSDSVWFIMGSLMFATAFVKTGVDKRLCMMLFNRLASPSVSIIIFIFVLVNAPLSSFISDHALAAIFLPVGLLLVRGAQKPGEGIDTELAKLMAITIAMGPNIGGFGAPSGGARNVIMMTYVQDMFGIDIGYFQWFKYGMPFVLVMIPITWLVLRWRFKPKTRDLSQALEMLRGEIGRMGPWSMQQVVTVVIFLATVWFWMTEESFFKMGIYPVRLGVGVIALGAGMAYILTGVVNWRDYHEKVDWGVVWLYAGAIFFGKMLDSSGAAYWIASLIVSGLSKIGLDHGFGLLASAGLLTGGITQLMADGPAAAAVGPVTLNMAGMVHPGTMMLPFMGMVTACASSFAYCLIIGTPPNAIAYASGYLQPRDFVRAGLPLWFVAQILLLLMVAFYWIPMGFGTMARF
jgi:sodium-dependent dicarboxylate transporter 2/3/5